MPSIKIVPKRTGLLGLHFIQILEIQSPKKHQCFKDGGSILGDQAKNSTEINGMLARHENLNFITFMTMMPSYLHTNMVVQSSITKREGW